MITSHNNHSLPRWFFKNKVFSCKKKVVTPQQLPKTSRQIILLPPKKWPKNIDYPRIVIPKKRFFLKNNAPKKIFPPKNKFPKKRK